MQSKLMNAAMSAFSRKGLNDCRMSDIADDAGLVRGAAYLYAFCSILIRVYPVHPWFNSAALGLVELVLPNRVLIGGQNVNSLPNGALCMNQFPSGQVMARTAKGRVSGKSYPVMR